MLHGSAAQAGMGDVDGGIYGSPAAAPGLAAPFMAPGGPVAAPPLSAADMTAPQEPVSFPWCQKGEVACLNVHLTGNVIVTACAFPCECSACVHAASEGSVAWGHSTRGLCCAGCGCRL